MNPSSIEKLEEKINQIFQQMNSLKETSQGLEQANAELKKQLEEKDRLIVDLETRCERYESQTQQAVTDHSREEEIRERISNVLEKLDQLESMI